MNIEKNCMDIEKKETEKSNELVKSSKYTMLEKSVEDLKQAKLIVDSIAESSTFSAAFIKRVETEDGKTETTVDKSAILTCILLGAELGMSPMMSLTFGRKLDREAAIKCKKGEVLGLDPISSMEHIYVFSTKQREIVYTGIHVVNKVLTDYGVKREILEDGTKPYVFYTYYAGSLKGKEVEIRDTNRSEYVVVNNGISPEILKAKLVEGCVPILLNHSKRAVVKLTKGDESIAIPYTLQQAIDADLYRGIKTDGSESTGKANWNSHPETHLVKMSIMLGGRIIASNKLNGIYEESEISIIKKSIIENESIEDATYEEA